MYGVPDDTGNYCANVNDRKYGYSKLPDAKYRLTMEEIAGARELQEQQEETIVEQDSDDDDNYMVSEDMRVESNRPPIEIIENLKPKYGFESVSFRSNS